ncbi:metastasis-associated in colon cancer protein 1 isoform X1 [Mobula hypostoma]|uniref:metastasis-associated in colon cancer protein 1 isoform X1 n=1 Tax=Mobula hypostoma TaxID=723540 RepID=UPI002FC3D5BE
MEVEEFIKAPTLEALEDARKSELIAVAKRVNLAKVKSTMRREEIHRAIVEHYVSKGVFPQGELGEVSIEKPAGDAVQVQLEKLRLEHEFRVRQLERQEKERELERQEKERELERQEKERELERQEKEREVERQERDRQLEREERERDRQLEREEKQREREFELEKLRIRAEQGLVPNQGGGFRATQEVRLVPPFDDTDVDRYFLHFEKVAISQEWPRDKWVVLLQSVLKGKAQQAYSALSAEDAQKYEVVKEAILRIYELVPEAYRQRFPNARKRWDRTYLEFAREMQTYCERWCASKGVEGDYDRLLQLILIEQFKGCVPEGMRPYLDEKEAATLAATAKLADEYALTHKMKFAPSKGYQKGSQDGGESPPEKSESKPGTSEKDKVDREQSGRKSPGVVCYNCGKVGHFASRCFAPRKETGKGKAEILNGCIELLSEPLGKDRSEKVQEGRERFISAGLVSVKKRLKPVPVRIWRDTGACQSLILKSVLEFSSETQTGEVEVKGVGEGTESVPLHQIHLQSNLVSGLVTIGVRSELPMKDVEVLLGNDIAGGIVFPVVRLTGQPASMEAPPAMVNLAETFLPTLYETGCSEIRGSEGAGTDVAVARKEFVQTQERDEGLMVFAETALSDTALTSYCAEEEVLRKKGKSSTASADEEWGVVQKSYGDEVFNMAHEVPPSGHFAVLEETVGGIMKESYRLPRGKNVIDHDRRELRRSPAFDMLTNLVGVSVEINEARGPLLRGKNHFEKIRMGSVRWEKAIVLARSTDKVSPLIPEGVIKRLAPMCLIVPRKCKELGRWVMSVTIGQPSKQHPYFSSNSVTKGLMNTEVCIGNLTRLSEASLIVNLEKNEFGHTRVTYLGIVVTQGQLAVMQATVQAIADLPTPTDKRALRRLLEMVGYCRKFCNNSAVNTRPPPTKPLREKTEPEWDDPCCCGPGQNQMRGYIGRNSSVFLATMKFAELEPGLRDY